MQNIYVNLNLRLPWPNWLSKGFSFFFTGKLVLNLRKKPVKDLKICTGEGWRI
jgi:hypothetical protein